MAPSAEEGAARMIRTGSIPIIATVSSAMRETVRYIIDIINEPMINSNQTGNGISEFFGILIFIKKIAS